MIEQWQAPLRGLKAGRPGLARTLLYYSVGQRQAVPREVPLTPRWSSLTLSAVFPPRLSPSAARALCYSQRLSSMPCATGESRLRASSRAFGRIHDVLQRAGDHHAAHVTDCLADRRAILFSTVKPRLIFCRGSAVVLDRAGQVLAESADRGSSRHRRPGNGLRRKNRENSSRDTE